LFAAIEIVFLLYILEKDIIYFVHWEKLEQKYYFTGKYSSILE